MKVAVAAAGRFHAIRLASELAKRGYLERFFTASPAAYHAHALPSDKLDYDYLCSAVDWMYDACSLYRFIRSSKLNAVKDRWFDHFIQQSIGDLEEVDIFTAWAHYCYESIPLIKQKARALIIESGSSHILEQDRLLQQEYDRWGLPWPGIQDENKRRMMFEYQAADFIVVPSTFVQEGFVRQGIAREKLIVVPCGVDIPHGIVPDAGERDLKFRALFVGLGSMRKGLHYLLQAWSRAGLPADQAELVIVGAVQQDIRMILPRLGPLPSVKFIGPVDKRRLNKLYQSSSVFVLPSIEDGFGMVIGEAMAHALPVICSRNTGAPDIIQHGNQGFLVEAANSDELADRIVWLFHHQADGRTMGMRAQETIQGWSWDLYGERIEMAYKKICGYSV